MTKKISRRPLTVPPAGRPPALPPPERGVGIVPPGAPPVEAPTPHVSTVPVERGVARVPNPRRLKLVEDAAGNELLDLFAIFPDLPRAPRPRAQTSLRRRIRRA